MIEEEKMIHFSYQEYLTLTDAEKAANEKLTQMRKKHATPLHNVVLQDFYDMKPKIEAS